MPTEKRPPGSLSPEQMKALGYRAIDRIVEHLDTVSSRPIIQKLAPEMAVKKLEELSFTPANNGAVDELFDAISNSILHVDHPRMFGFIPGPSSFYGILGQLLTSGLNIFGGTWLESSLPTQIEIATARKLADRCGLPDTAGGIFLSGGSMANLSAIVMARETHLGAHDSSAKVYCSEQTHSSIEKAMRMLGFAPEQLTQIPVDDHHRMDVAELDLAIATDRNRGGKPFLVVANAGTTNTGSVDPLSEISAICRRQEIWLHVDAAYGGGALFSRKRRSLLQGIESADSVTIDGHKWLFQPYGIGCLLARDTTRLHHAFHASASYLVDTKATAQEVNMYDWGPELTRGCRGLRLWLTMEAMGEAELEAAIECGFANSEKAQTLIADHRSWEIVTPAQMAIVTFRYNGSSSQPSCDRVTQAVVEELIKDGTAFVSATHLQGRPALRMCTIHPATTTQDLVDTLDALTRCADIVLARLTNANSDD